MSHRSLDEPMETRGEHIGLYVNASPAAKAMAPSIAGAR